MGVILALFALSCALSTVSDAAAYSDMKRQQIIGIKCGNI